jgi:hypothetical protein
VLKKNTNLWPPDGLPTRGPKAPLPFGDPAVHRLPPSPYDRSLNRAAIAWLEQLPPSIAPVSLAIQYPRIVNRLSRFWDSPKMIEECFRELIVDKRGKRKGFPKKVLDELHALAQYYRTLHPKAETDLWGSIPYRRSDDA